jgi:hypothetical protein
MRNVESLIGFVVRQSEGVRVKARVWTTGEDAFLKQNLGYLTDLQIGQALGRSENAVRLRWKRDLDLPSPSKAPDVITADGAARLLGIDGHKTAHWVDKGLIPGRLMAGARKIRLIKRSDFERWVLSPSNWIWFDPKRVQDARLKRLCRLRAKRWGDEWWPANRVAKYHGVDTKDVQRLIYRGEIPAVQLPVSLGGRNENRAWSNWFVKKSDALQAHFVKGKGIQAWQPTPRAVIWIRKAWRQGMNFSEICRTMGSPVTDWTLRQYMVRNGLAKRRKR